MFDFENDIYVLELNNLVKLYKDLEDALPNKSYVTETIKKTENGVEEITETTRLLENDNRESIRQVIDSCLEVLFNSDQLTDPDESTSKLSPIHRITIATLIKYKVLEKLT